MNFTDLYEHLPVLQIVIPILTAPICVLLRHSRVTWVLAMVVAWAALAMSAMLLGQVLDQGTITYALGGWAPSGVPSNVATKRAVHRLNAEMQLHLDLSTCHPSDEQTMATILASPNE